MNLEKIILQNLFYNEEFTRKIIAFLKEDYFHNIQDKTVFQFINEYIKKYNTLPTRESLIIEINSCNTLSENQYKESIDLISSLEEPTEKQNINWLLDTAEKFCQDKALYNAIMASINIIDDKTGHLSKGQIPKILQEALAVSFDQSIGHDFIDNWEQRFDFYNLKEAKIAFNLDFFNKITNGGVSRKTLNVALAGTGVGKSLFMCHCAGSNLSMGHNVLYITLEMAQEEIAKRIDCNLLDISINKIKEQSKKDYSTKINKLKNKTNGKLIIKEYPPATANASNFRHIINELKLKKNFIPDIIYIDYINLCTSSRYKASAQVNSYTIVKAIAEELRGLAVEFNVPLITATQTTRSGYSNSDVGLEDTSESFGLPATADMMFALITSEELEKMGQILVKQLKNRYADPSQNRRFVIGVDKTKMRLYDTEQAAQDDIVDNRPVMDKSHFGERYENDEILGDKPSFKKNLFNGLK